MPDAFAIRPMRPHEMRETAEVWQASQRATYTWMREDQLHPLEEAIAFFCDSISRRCRVWVAAAGDRVVGMMALEGALIDHLFIHPDFQNRRLGDRFVALAKAECPDGLRLVTLQRNARARRFYEARGFVATGRGVSPPPENEPDVWYEWRPVR